MKTARSPLPQGIRVSWVLAILAAGKVATWLALGAPGSGDPPRSILVVLVVGLTAAAAVLMAGGQRDVRVVHLGALFFVSAAVFADFRPFLGAYATVGTVGERLRFEALTPYLLWSFFSAFPRATVFPRTRRRLRLVRGFALGIGTLLLVAEAALGVASLIGSPAPSAVTALTRDGLGNVFWAVLAGLSLPAPLYGLWTARWAPEDERRRARIMLLGLVVAVAPISVYLILSGVSTLAPVLDSDAGVAVIRVVFYTALLGLPVVTAYAVLVDEVLEVRSLMRIALGYVLARFTVAGVMLLPFLLAPALIWRMDLRPGAAGFGILVALAVGAALVLRYRDGLLGMIDDRFFPEIVATRASLRRLEEECGAAGSPEGLRTLLETGLRQAFRTDRVMVMMGQAVDGDLTSASGHPPPLSPRSVLARRLVRAGPAVRFDATDQRALASLPESDQHWLIDSGAGLLVPMVVEESLVGLMAVGQDESQAIDPEVRNRLASIGATAGVTVRRYLEERPRDPRPAPGIDERSLLGRECPACVELFEPATRLCGRCGSVLLRSRLPWLLAGRYRMRRRIGSGGMGVVFLAEDQDRPGSMVAVKTLPELRPSQAARLRQEARAMEVISHPHLARLESVETWQGVPFLVFEYLPGGTLADRLRNGPMGVAPTIELGRTLARATGVIHDVRILHRDIKPSNIGFDEGGAPKILDFGLAKAIDVVRAGPGEDGLSVRHLDVSTATGVGPVGSVHYLSPEAVRGSEPDPSFDLWSIAVVLFESMTGRRPVSGPTVASMLVRIVEGDLLRLDEVMPHPPRALRGFFRDCFSLDLRLRPRSAAELDERLRILSLQLSQ